MFSRHRSPLVLVTTTALSVLLLSSGTVGALAPAAAEPAPAVSGEAVLAEQVDRAVALSTAAQAEATSLARRAGAARTVADRHADLAASARAAAAAAADAAGSARAKVQTAARETARATAAVQARRTRATRARATAAARTERTARSRAASAVRAAETAAARSARAVEAADAASRAAATASHDAKLAGERAAQAKALADAAAAVLAAVRPATAPAASPDAAPGTPTATAPTGRVDTAPAVRPAAAAPAFTATTLRPFAKGKAFYSPIPASPRLDPDNDAIVPVFAKKGEGRVLNRTQYGQPIYTATPQTPRYTLIVKNAGTKPGQWGHNDLEQGSVPIPDDAAPSPGNDGKLVVIDPVARKVYDMWQAKRVGATWSVSWGGVYDLDGDGSSHNVRYGRGPDKVEWPKPVSRGTGSGISSAAGVLRIEEVVAGRADHALVFSTNMPCGPNDSGNHRFPATSTDGWVEGAPCLPQGARLQLDPSIDLTRIKGITPIELTVGRALQTYGAYAMDQGGARMAIVAEVPSNAAEKAVYTDAGVAWDYFGLTNLPWDKIRVLASYDGS